MLLAHHRAAREAAEASARELSQVPVEREAAPPAATLDRASKHPAPQRQQPTRG